MSSSMIVEPGSVDRRHDWLVASAEYRLEDRDGPPRIPEMNARSWGHVEFAAFDSWIRKRKKRRRER